MKRAVGYVRLSQKDKSLSKEEMETSLINQENEIKSYCQKKGYQLIEIYKEKYITGDSPNRPEFNRMRNDAYDRKFDVSVVRDMSRFTREGADKQEDLIIEFGVNKVEIESMSEDTSSELTRYLLGVVNKVIIIMGRMKTEQMRRGKKAIGRAYIKAPFGYKNLKGKKEYWVVTKDALIVKEVFRRKILKQSMQKIIGELGISEKQYCTIIKNRCYVGVKDGDSFKSIVHHKHYIKDSNKVVIDVQIEEYIGFHEPLISPSDWLLVHPEDKGNLLLSSL